VCLLLTLDGVDRFDVLLIGAAPAIDVLSLAGSGGYSRSRSSSAGLA
jgi:hypothetical protein